MDGGVFILPIWRHSANLVAQNGFPPGHVLTYEWLYDSFQIEMPTDDMAAASADDLRWKFLSDFKNFERELLEIHLIAIRNVKGIGYEIVAPQDQTQWGFDSGIEGIKKAMHKAVTRVSYVDLDKLTPDQRKENADTKAKLAQIASFHKERLKLS